MSVLIQGTFSSALGNGPSIGSVTVSWPAFTDGTSGAFHPAGVQTVNVARDGSYRFTLAPTANSAPPTFYTATYHLLNGSANAVEHWTVPAITPGTALTVPQIRVNKTVPPPPFLIQSAQLFDTAASIGDCLIWTGTRYQPVTIQRSYPFAFTNQNVLTIPGVTHGQGAALIVCTFDMQGNLLYPAINVQQVSGDVVITYGDFTTGYGFISGGLGRGLPNFAKGFVGTNTATILKSEHRFNNANLAISVYDQDGNIINASTQISISPNYDIQVTLSSAQNFNVVVAGGLGNTDAPNPQTIPYTQLVAAQTTVTITADVHGKGTTPLAFFITDETPGLSTYVPYTRTANGDISATFGSPFTGTVEIISGGFYGQSAAYTQAIPNPSTTLTIPASTHWQGENAIAFVFSADTPAQALQATYTRALNGDITLSFSPAIAGGTVQIMAGGWRGSSLYTKAFNTVTSVTIPVTDHLKGANALVAAFATPITPGNPADAVALTWTRDWGGNIVCSFQPPFTGAVQVFSPS
jgi:hypothetical protein